MLIRINQIKLKPDYKTADLYEAVCGIVADILNKPVKEVQVQYKLVKQSVDSRFKPDIMYICSVEISMIKCSSTVIEPEKFISKCRKSRVKQAKDIVLTKKKEYAFAYNADNKIIGADDINRPVIIGFGPAGMFAAYHLAKAGFRPVVYERGQAVDERIADVNNFWSFGELDTESNVQFGEGGAGTFSDGKLNTAIKDSSGRIQSVLETFVKFGADEAILYNNKPHIGTDVLTHIVKNLRESIIAYGGEIHFDTKLENIVFKNKEISELMLKNVRTNECITRECKNVCLAIGHSARDTFEMLESQHFVMEPKSFAVGLRIEHPQSFIDYYSYGDSKYKLPAADYKVSWKTSSGRGVYSFCMCPGGYVVNASSEPGHLAVNGMSYSGRDSANANSAVIVTVTPDDFGRKPLDGMNFQRKLECRAYQKGSGHIPVQLLGDFKNKVVSTGFGRVMPSVKGKVSFADLNEVITPEIAEAICEGVDGFSRAIKGFNMEDAVFLGVESRTSSPLRIIRDDNMEASFKGVFPCGEGAGYAGGITSAAVDGIKVAEKMAEKILMCS